MKRDGGHEFIVSLHRDDNGSGPRAVHFRNLGRFDRLSGFEVLAEVLPLEMRAERGEIITPDGFAGSLVDGDEEAAVTRPKVQEAKLFVQNGRGGVARGMGLLAEVASPQLPPVQVVTEEAG